MHNICCSMKLTVWYEQMVFPFRACAGNRNVNAFGRKVEDLELGGHELVALWSVMK